MKNKKDQLVYAWWEVPGQINSKWERPDGTMYLSAAGWVKWANDPKAPNLHDLNAFNRVHVKKYA